MAETHIQIGDITPRIQYTGDGAQTVFTYPFPIFKTADMEVYLDDVKQATGFTVNGAGQSAGGDVTFDTAPANDVLVTLRRRLAIQRTSDFQESGEFRSKVINDELDILTASLQQVNDDLERSLRLGATDTATSLELPDKSTRASKFLGFDASGDPIATDASGPQGPVGPAGNMDGSNNLSEITNAATARTNLGLGALATKATVATADMDPAAKPYDVAFNAGFGSDFTGADLVVQTYGEMVMTRSGSFTGEAGYIDTVATGAAVIVDVLKNGTTIYTTKPQFDDGANALTAGTLKTDGTEDYVADDRITFKVTQIGSTVAGQKLRFTAKGIIT